MMEENIRETGLEAVLRQEEEPNEVYRFTFTPDELDEIQRLQKKKLAKMLLSTIFPVVVMAVIFIFDREKILVSSFLMGAMFCYFVLALIRALKYRRGFLKNWKFARERIAVSVYEYRFFDDRFSVKIYRDGGVTENICRYAEVSFTYELGNWLFLLSKQKIYIFRKSDLRDDSVLFSDFRDLKTVAKQEEAEIRETSDKKRTPGIWIAVSIILFVASISTIYFALMIVGRLSENNGMFTRNMWGFFLLLPVPLASLVLGIVMKKKGYSYKKNIIIGIIMTVFLSLFGAFCFIFPETPVDHAAEIVRIEELTGVDLPEFEQFSFTFSSEEASVEGISNMGSGTVDEDAAKAFERQIMDDEKWMTQLPNNLIGILSPIRRSGYYFYDYLLIYNVDAEEFNTLPEKSGTYRFVNITYCIEDHSMSIDEYEVEYVE